MSITLLLVILTCIVSYRAFENRELYSRLKHHPYSVARYGEYHRFLTSGFVHVDWTHLLINMYVFYIFGEVVESRFLYEFGNVFGRIYFILLYLVCIVAADLPSFFKHRDYSGYSAVGASGGVSGITFAFVLFYPWHQLLLFFIIPMPAIVFAVLYLVYSSYASKNINDNIGHDAHFFGAITGFIFTILLKPALLVLFMQQLLEFQ